MTRLRIWDLRIGRKTNNSVVKLCNKDIFHHGILQQFRRVSAYPAMFLRGLICITCLQSQPAANLQLVMLRWAPRTLSHAGEHFSSCFRRDGEMPAALQISVFVVVPACSRLAVGANLARRIIAIKCERYRPASGEPMGFRWPKMHQIPLGETGRSQRLSDRRLNGSFGGVSCGENKLHTVSLNTRLDAAKSLWYPACRPTCLQPVRLIPEYSV